MQLFLKNAHYYANGSFHAGNIQIDKGIIVRVGEDIADEASCDKVLDVQGLWVLPGLIDSHVHFRYPGPNQSEDFFSGSLAAAAGGITTVCEMPNVQPIPDSPEALKKRVDQLEGQSLVDMAFYGAAGFSNRHNLRSLLEAGVVAMKTFLAKDAPTLSASDDGELYLLLCEAAKTDGRFMFHCENQEVIDRLTDALKAQGVQDNSFHYRSRPDVAEVEAVSTVIQFAKATGAKVGVCHISVPAACKLVKKAQKEGVDIIAETCWHYLILDQSYIDEFGPYAKCNPPLRSFEDAKGLWDYLYDGTISMIGSDHAPHLVADKQKGVEQPIWNAPSGLASIEVMLPIMLTAVNRGRLLLEDVPRFMSEGAAKNLGLYPQKGTIKVGSDADFTIIDLEKNYVFAKENMHTRAKEVNLLFDKLPVQGMPVYTIVRGEVMMAHGHLALEKKGHGRFVARK